MGPKIDSKNQEYARDAIKARLEAQRLAADRDFDIMCLQEMRLMAAMQTPLLGCGGFASGGFGGGFCCMGGLC